MNHFVDRLPGLLITLIILNLAISCALGAVHALLVHLHLDLWLPIAALLFGCGLLVRLQQWARQRRAEAFQRDRREQPDRVTASPSRGAGVERRDRDAGGRGLRRRNPR